MEATENRCSRNVEGCSVSLAGRKMDYPGADVTPFLDVTTSAVVRVADFEDLPEIKKYL